MAGYIILSTKTRGPGLRRKRREHLESASVTFGQGVPDLAWEIDTLLIEQAKGTAFVMETGASPIEKPRATFVRCECGKGYFLKLGPTALELVREARGEVGQ